MSQKKQKQRAEQIRQAELAASPIYQRYWKQFTAFAIGVVGIVGFAVHQVKQNEIDVAEKQSAAQKLKYGQLLQYKDEIPKLMMAKARIGEGFAFENFLPQLQRQNGKFIVNVFIGEPPRSKTGMQLSEVPEGKKQTILNGLNYWSDFVVIKTTNDRDAANLRIYCEDAILPMIKVSGVSMDPLRFESMGWRNHKADMDIMENAILVNREELYIHPHSTYGTVAHEFGHNLGLQHVMQVMLELTGDKESLQGKDITYVTKKYRDITLRFPQLKELSMLNGSADFERTEPGIGELDKAAMECVVAEFDKKYRKDYQPSKRVEPVRTGGESKVWQEHLNKDSAGIPGPVR